MKVGFLIATLRFVAVVQAKKYELSCSKTELSIRWPSYESNSEYYVCPRLFGKQMTVTCNPGEVFTFVMQSCTAPNKYIPAPALEVLPTADPLLSQPNNDDFLTPIKIPQPPAVSPIKPEVPIDMPAQQPPFLPVGIPKVPVISIERPKEEDSKPVEKEEAVLEKQVKPLPPLPPTPAPTPPVVANEPKKKLGAVSSKNLAVNKKKSSAKPSKNGKQKVKAEKSPKKIGKKPKSPTKKQPKV